MVDKKRRELESFRKRQAALRDEEWARTIEKARGFTGLETLRQGFELSEKLLEVRRIRIHRIY